jgi:hypothetical protein
MVTVTASPAAAGSRSHRNVLPDTLMLKQLPLSTKSPSPSSTAAAFVGCWLPADEPKAHLGYASCSNLQKRAETQTGSEV